MFEALAVRVARRADEMAAQMAQAVADDIAADLPPGARVEIAGDEIEVTGRGLALHSTLRWLGARRGR